jgi:hypothetical protein
MERAKSISGKKTKRTETKHRRLPEQSRAQAEGRKARMPLLRL